MIRDDEYFDEGPVGFSSDRSACSSRRAFPVPIPLWSTLGYSD